MVYELGGRGVSFRRRKQEEIDFCISYPDVFSEYYQKYVSLVVPKT